MSIRVGKAGEHLIAVWTDDVPEQKMYATREEWEAFIAKVKAGEFDATR